MRITEELKLIEKVMRTYGEDILPQLIRESFNHWEDGTATAEDKFILGLRYSEFLANQNARDYDAELVAADKRSTIYRDRLGITMAWLMEQCSLLGLN